LFTLLFKHLAARPVLAYGGELPTDMSAPRGFNFGPEDVLVLLARSRDVGRACRRIFLIQLLLNTLLRKKCREEHVWGATRLSPKEH
jgi:hypothetical protein